MRIRHCWLYCCTISERFQSSVKYFQVGRYFISDRRTGDPPFLSDRRTKGHAPPTPFPSEARPLELCSLALARTRSLSSTSEATSSITPREGSVDGWGKYGLKGQNKSAQGNALGIVCNQHSPRMGKRIIISPTPFATLQWWAVILLPPSGAYPCCIQFPGRCPGLTYQCPFGA